MGPLPSALRVPLVPLLLNLGCGGAPADAPDASDTGPDEADTDTDADADADADTDTDSDTDDTGDGPPLPDDGYVSVVWTRTNDEAPTAFLLGQVYEVLAPGVAAVHFAEPQHVDDCAITSYTVDDLAQGSLPTYAYQSGGTLTVTPPTGAPLTVAMGAGNMYYRVLGAHTVPFGEAYAVDAPGGTFPAFSGELAVPSQRDMIAPAPGFVASGPLRVQWSGGDPGELLLRLEGMDDAGRRALIMCRVANDGEHTVPSALVQQLPSGRVTLHLEQAHRADVAAGARWIRLTGSVVDIVVGSAP